jgi:heptosyltransferase-2
MHVADAVGVPIVAVFGPTDWVTTPPYGKTHTIVRHPLECAPCLKRVCPLGHHDCMKKIPVEEVERACLPWIR